MKTCLFASSQLVARSLDPHEIFCVVYHEYRTFFNGICYIGAYGMLSLLRCGKTIAFPIGSCTFTPQNGEKSYPGYDV